MNMVFGKVKTSIGAKYHAPGWGIGGVCYPGAISCLLIGCLALYAPPSGLLVLATVSCLLGARLIRAAETQCQPR